MQSQAIVFLLKLGGAKIGVLALRSFSEGGTGKSVSPLTIDTSRDLGGRSFLTAEHSLIAKVLCDT